MAAPENDWYLNQWLDAVGVRFPHAWLVKETGFSEGKCSNLLSGKKRYDKDVINVVAGALKVRPYELLMHPEEAFRIRRMQQTVAEAARAMGDASSAELDLPRRKVK